MRKFVLVALVVFTTSIFALASLAQRPRRGRGRGRVRAAAVATVPSSPRIAVELGGLAWGSTHDQVVEYFRRAITARFQPLLRNKGQVEQDQLMQVRDREIDQLRRSYISFNGANNQRRWDTSFVGEEYTHNNSESMLVREEPASGNREFFFFFNDRLWKRYQARAIPQGSGVTYDAFVRGLEAPTLFGPGLHIQNPENAAQLQTVVWQDATTRVHLANNATFYNSFGLIFEELATQSRLAELRRNAPPASATKTTARRDPNEPIIGNVESDSNPDIVDRITGKMRRTTQASPDAGAARPTGTGTGTGTGTTPSSGNTTDNDPLRGL